MAAIDATARVADGARIGDDVEIGPYCLVGPDVELIFTTALEGVPFHLPVRAQSHDHAESKRIIICSRAPSVTSSS